jgi:hypothetical protein
VEPKLHTGYLTRTMSDPRLDWAPIFRDAWDETPTLRPRYSLGSLAVSVLAQLIEQDAQVAPVSRIVFVLTAWLAVSLAWFSINLVRVPARLYAQAQQQIATFRALAPKVSVQLLSTPTPMDPLRVRVRIASPNEETSFNDPWTIAFRDSQGAVLIQAEGILIGGNNYVRKGDVVSAEVRFDSIDDFHPNSASLWLTTTDIHGHRVEAEYPVQ